MKHLANCRPAGAIIVGIISVTLCGCSTPAASINPMRGRVSGAQSWLSIRNANLVRQTYDYSCGASSIATLLTYYFGQPTTELQVLSALPAVDRPYSLSDMQAALKELGYESIILRSNYLTLEALSSPVILYLHPRRTRTTVGHFVVLRSVGSENVVLADPAVGIRVHSKSEFLNMWLGGDYKKWTKGVFLIVRSLDIQSAPSSRGGPIKPSIRPPALFWKGGQQRRYFPPPLLSH